jgi:two-component system phosphate regulon sensor histidine kinase PhoR
MFVHKDIIIVFLFLFVVSLILLIIFIKDLKIISKSLQNFKGNAVRSDKVFFFNLFQPLIFNLNLIIKNLNEKSKFSRLRIFFYDYFFQFFPDPLLIIDQNNIIIEMNEQAIDFFGEDSKQKNIFSAIRIPELSSLIDESVKQKKPVEKELNLIYPKEKIFNIWISGRRDLGKNKLNFIRLFDATSQHNIQNIQRDFIANASHELKTPIASIIGYCETLINESPKKNSKKEEFLKTMFNEASRMSSLVKDLLSLTRIERIEYIPPEGKVNLNEILENIRKTCKERKFLSKTKYQFSIPKRKTEIIGDESELEQVFFNIIENALTHSQSKKPVQIKLMTKLNTVVFLVQDFGIGISNQNIPMLTKRFYRIDTSRPRDTGHTGLGLSIVKHILNRHNAQLNIQSEVNKGSSFSITFEKYKSS